MPRFAWRMGGQKAGLCLTEVGRFLLITQCNHSSLQYIRASTFKSSQSDCALVFNRLKWGRFIQTTRLFEGVPETPVQSSSNGVNVVLTLRVRRLFNQ